jgi:dimethylglycine dehydrogenase
MARFRHPPDGNPLIGPAPGVKNYWCCCGTQIGIGWGPGLTRELARWMVHGAADISMRDYRSAPLRPYATKEWQVIKAKEDYCLRHEIPFPHFNRLAAGRSSRRRCTSAEGQGRGVRGSLRPRAPALVRPMASLAAGRPLLLRRTPVVRHGGHRMRTRCASAPGIMDISAFTKVEVAGPGAYALLDRLVANRLPQTRGIA